MERRNYLQFTDCTDYPSYLFRNEKSFFLFAYAIFLLYLFSDLTVKELVGGICLINSAFEILNQILCCATNE